MPTLPAIADQSATVGTAFYSLTFTAATGGDPPLTYSVSGEPSWLTLSNLTLSGTPDAAGTHTVTVTVEDDDGDTDTSSFTLTVSAASVLLTLADFSVPSGHDEVDAALITSELDTNGWYYNIDLSLGTVEDGSIEPEAGHALTRIRHNGTNLFQLNDNPNTTDLSAFFASGGTGNDLTIHIQDATGVVSFVVADQTVDSAGINWVRWTVPDAFETVLARIGSGDLFIIAFTRASVTDLFPTLPSIADQSATVGTVFSSEFHGGHRRRHAPRLHCQRQSRLADHLQPHSFGYADGNKALRPSRLRLQMMTAIPTQHRSS